MQNVYTVD